MAMKGKKAGRGQKRKEDTSDSEEEEEEEVCYIMTGIHFS